MDESNETEDCRKMEITWKTTPAELRIIANYLEGEGCRQVRVNWYHTRLIFMLDEPIPLPSQSVVELQGDKKGEDQSTQDSKRRR